MGILDEAVMLRWLLTVAFILVGMVYHKWCVIMLIIVSIFCEVYWYLWQKEKSEKENSN